MSPSGIGLGAIFAFVCSLGISRPWPLNQQRQGGNASRTGTKWTECAGESRQEKVLNFISLPASDECVSDDGRRIGLCLNAYECRIQSGMSNGRCAFGFGVCCVFSATCGGDAVNNLTYFVSPQFPRLFSKAGVCEFTVNKIAPEISQLRLDFIHFSLAQPNRKNGVCESDVMTIEIEGSDEFPLCGLNNGQHLYYDVEGFSGPIKIIVNLTKDSIDRLWEIKITQIEFQKKTPPGCLQYFTEPKGTIRTINFAENGRHLSNQDYTICVRQEEGICSIVYEPCDENSFKIGPARSDQGTADGSGYGEIGDTGSAEPECGDKILMPCDSEEFITSNEKIPGVCQLLHCGSSFCPEGEFPCRIESSTVPFNIRVQFGPALEGESPDDNLGMCLKYEQFECF